MDADRLLEARLVLEPDDHIVVLLEHLGGGLGEPGLVPVEGRHGQEAGQASQEGKHGRDRRTAPAAGPPEGVDDVRQPHERLVSTIRKRRRFP